MKRHSSLIPISREHHKVLLCAQLLKADVPSYEGMPADPAGKIDYFLSFYSEVLEAHMDKEEKLLFPFVSEKASALQRLIRELTTDHEEIRRLSKNLDSASEMIAEHLDELGRLLEKHVRREERQLFQRIQELLSEGQLLELSKLLTT
ncbi:hemerythrin domain-containing protein [Roseivirga sp. BDSF3-8]|uniref:hemerythrin domain-containing protein n=1 Tax=Roseivirga sp. BDSF3-8 TaxID=3241598 RepID=UPI003532521A